MIGGRCPDQVDLAYIVSTYEENSANNHLFLKVHLISFDSMYNMCMGGSTKSQKAGRLKRLEAKIVKKPASYRDYVET